jgi:hypothetical protein
LKRAERRVAHPRLSDGARDVAEQSVEDILKTAASKPSEIQGDAGRVKQHPLGDLVKADEWLTKKASARSLPRMLKTSSPGGREY